jgi:hypothetical protein
MADLANRKVDLGDVLVADFEDVHYVLEVVSHPEKENDFAFKLVKPEGYAPEHAKGLIQPGLFRTLSGAAETITFPKQRNGWTFWKESDEAPVAEKTTTKRGRRPKAPEPVEEDEGLIVEEEEEGV